MLPDCIFCIINFLWLLSQWLVYMFSPTVQHSIILRTRVRGKFTSIKNSFFCNVFLSLETVSKPVPNELDKIRLWSFLKNAGATVFFMINTTICGLGWLLTSLCLIALPVLVNSITVTVDFYCVHHHYGISKITSIAVFVKESRPYILTANFMNSNHTNLHFCINPQGSKLKLDVDWNSQWVTDTSLVRGLTRLNWHTDMP